MSRAFANHCTTKPTPSWRRFRKIYVVLQILKPEKKVLFPKPTIDLPFYNKKRKKRRRRRRRGKRLKPSRPINFAQKKVRDYCKEIYYRGIQNPILVPSTLPISTSLLCKNRVIIFTKKCVCVCASIFFSPSFFLPKTVNLQPTRTLSLNS